MEIVVKYDREGDALSIKFKEASGRVVTQVLSEKVAEYIPLELEDIALDFDEAGKLVGIEVLSASRYFEGDFLLRAESRSMPLPSTSLAKVKLGSL